MRLMLLQNMRTCESNTWRLETHTPAYHDGLKTYCRNASFAFTLYYMYCSEISHSLSIVGTTCYQRPRQLKVLI